MLNFQYLLFLFLNPCQKILPLPPNFIMMRWGSFLFLSLQCYLMLHPNTFCPIPILRPPPPPFFLNTTIELIDQGLVVCLKTHWLHIVYILIILLFCIHSGLALLKTLASHFLPAYQTAHHCQHRCYPIGWMVKICFLLTWMNYRKSWSPTLCWNSFKRWMIHRMVISTKTTWRSKQMICYFHYL